MKNIQKICLLLFCVILLFGACKKEGLGGKSSIKGYVTHHSFPIPNSVIYIKYGAIDFPGPNPSNYDASVTANAKAYYEFNNLRKGNYYLYGVGYDSSKAVIVVGGVAVKLRNKENRKNDVIISE